MFARQASLAAHARTHIDPAMQVDRLGAAGGLVQAIDVLRHQSLDTVLLLQARQGTMRIVGPRTAQPPPADQAARPVAPAGRRVAHKCLEHYWRGAFPPAVSVAVVRDAGFGAAAGAGENEQAGISLDELCESMFVHGT